jgi:hypothetical protein
MVITVHDSYEIFLGAAHKHRSCREALDGWWAAYSFERWLIFEQASRIAAPKNMTSAQTPTQIPNMHPRMPSVTMMDDISASAIFRGCAEPAPCLRALRR